MSEVVPIREDDVQFEFGGMPIRKLQMALVQASKLYTDYKPEYNENVRLVVDGRCKGTKAVDGVLTVLIEVLDATFEAE